MTVIRVRNHLRLLAIWLRRFYLVSVYGMDIAPSARISWGVRLDKTHPKGIHIGDESYLTSGCLVLTHDFCRGFRGETHIGRRCFVGADAIILPGVRIGDSAVVGAGSVVTRDVPAGSIVAGNPARVLSVGISTECFGRIAERGGTVTVSAPPEIGGYAGIQELPASRGRPKSHHKISPRA